MMTKTKEKIVVLGVSFALFLGGVWAIWMERGALRTAILAAAFAGLLAIALRQSLNKRKKKE